ncbi:tset complex member tsta [Anaeramoeba flamelloides]|uniref:Tset complex member tsta n=1 Tax=Anaeramoeba flamelloides TaxID=1746091 RepID=A0AAV7YXG9_9EUKA|nr:tset complex member tsta [Anaeramoeba flamelloides]
MESIETSIKLNLVKQKDQEKQLNSLIILSQNISQGRQLNEFFDLIIKNCLLNETASVVIKIMSYQIIKQSPDINNIRYKNEWKKLTPIIEKDLKSSDPNLAIAALRILLHSPISILRQLLTDCLPHLFEILDGRETILLTKPLIFTFSRIVLYHLGSIPELDLENCKEIYGLIGQLALDHRDEISVIAFSAIRQLFLEISQGWVFAEQDSNLDQFSERKQLTKLSQFVSQSLVKQFDTYRERFSCLNSKDSYVCLIPLAIAATQELIPNNLRTKGAKEVIKNNIQKLVEKHLFLTFNSMNEEIIFEVCSILLYLAQVQRNCIQSRWVYLSVVKLLELLERDSEKINLTILLDKIGQTLPLLDHFKQINITKRLFPFVELLKERIDRFSVLTQIYKGILFQALEKRTIQNFRQNINVSNPISKYFESNYVINLCQSEGDLFLDECIYCLCKCTLGLYGISKFKQIVNKLMPKKNRNFDQIQPITLQSLKEKEEKENQKEKNEGIEINLFGGNNELDLMDTSNTEEETTFIIVRVLTALDVIHYSINSKIWSCEKLTCSVDSLLRLCDRTFYYAIYLTTESLLHFKVQELIGVLLKLYAEKKIRKVDEVFLYIISKYIQNNGREELGLIIFELVKKLLMFTEINSQTLKVLTTVSNTGNFGQLYKTKMIKKFQNDTLNKDEKNYLEKKKLNKKKKKLFIKKIFSKNKKNNSLKNYLKNYQNIDESQEPNYYLLFQTCFIISIRFPNLRKKILQLLKEFISQNKSKIKPYIQNCKLTLNKIKKYSLFKDFSIKSFLNHNFLTKSEENPTNLDRQFRFLFQQTQKNNYNYFNIDNKNKNENENENENNNNNKTVGKNGNDGNGQLRINKNNNLINKINVKSFESEKVVISGLNDLFKIEAFHLIEEKYKRVDWKCKITNITNIKFTNIILKLNFFGMVYPLKGENSLSITILNLEPERPIEWSVPFSITQLSNNSFSLEVHFKKSTNPKEILISQPYILPIQHFLTPSLIPFSFFMDLWSTFPHSIIIETVFVKKKTPVSQLIDIIKTKPFAMISSKSFSNNSFLQYTFLSETWFGDKFAFVLNGIKEFSIQNSVFRIEIRTENSFVLDAVIENQKFWIKFLSDGLLETKNVY